MYDLKCDDCGGTVIDVLEPINAAPHRCDCGGTMRRAWLTTPPNVIPDDIPGGVLIHNGLCGPGGAADPIRYYSKSEINRAAKAKGLQQRVEHEPSQGSDKNRFKFTQRWV
jgi:hypothetical protein